MSVPVYSYIFQEEEQVTAAFFTTKTGTGYRVYFYPAADFFSQLDPGSLLYRFGYYFGFTKLDPNEGKSEPIDLSVRATIIHIIDQFFANNGHENVLIFYCDGEDGKNGKRAKSFQRWFENVATETHFDKYDEEIILLSDEGNAARTDYLSLIIERNNTHNADLLNEFQLLKEQFIANK